ncbi:hypothetical protein HKD37_17G047987 [Glycine soja]
MDRQELPRLLAKAKAMADTYSAPEEIHGLLSYCQHMIDLMAHIIRSPDMSALKEQMASMMEAMLGMKRLKQSNAATAVATSTVVEADPALLTATHHPIPNIVGRERSTLGHVSNPHPGYNRGAYPYDLPPKYTPPAMHEDMGHITPLILEGEPPWHPDGSRNHPTQPMFLFVGGPPSAAEGKEKLDLIEERLRVVEGFGDYPFVDMTDLCLVSDVVIPSKFKVQKDDMFYEVLQKAGMIPRGKHKEDSCLMHSGVLHDMETCSATKAGLRSAMRGGEEQHICMQSADKEGPKKPKPLVIHFTRDTTPQRPPHPSTMSGVRSIPFPYKNSRAVPWRYAPLGGRKEEATHIGSLSAKVTNITGLNDITRSGRMFAPPGLPMQPANFKGKAKVIEGQNVKVIPTPGEDGCDKKEVSLEEASEFLRIIQQSEIEVIEQLNKTPTRVSLLELLMSSKPHRDLFNDESHQGTNTGDPAVDFEQEASWTKDEEDEDVGLPPELERIFTHKDQEIRPIKKRQNSHGYDRPIHEELVALLRDYQDVFAWTYQDMPVKSLDVTSLKELGRLMGPLQRQAFRKVYRKILDLTAAKLFTEAVVSLAQYYDQPLSCFTFGDFQMVPTIEEFEEILGCPLGGRKSYLFSSFLPSLSKIAAVVGDSAKELDHTKQTRNGVVGLPRKYLEGKARDMASQEKWGTFADILALLIFGVVLFPNVDGLVDLAAIDAFLAYHHSKESPVVAILADLFDTFDRRCEKNSARIVCCLPALCVWLISHLFQQDTRHPCPLQRYRSCAEKGRVDWDQHLAGIGGSAINWFPRWKDGKEGVIFSCGDYPNVPLIGTRGCINYNPALVIRQLGYPMRGAPTEESLSPFLVRNLGAQSLEAIQRVHKAWRSPLRKDKELRGIRNGVIGGYHGWLRIHTRGLDWLSKLKVIDEENFEAPEEDEEVRALKLELGKAMLAKEKFKSAATHIRKECTERSLAQHLEATEQSMLAIIGQYKEELNQSMAHEQKLVAEKEARGRVIDALHQEATMWMDRFALTLNGSQDLSRLLAKAKAMAKVCTAPEEIHGLINYCQHMIDLMAHIIRNPGNSLPTQVKGPPAAERVPAQRTAPTAPRPINNTAPGASYKYAQHPPPKDNFSPIPMAYSELWPSLLENHLVVAIPGKVFQPPYPKWYDPGAKCVYHSGAPGHNIDSCIPFKYKVQHLISAGWLAFQEQGPNVKTNPLASHGGASVNAIEEDGPSRAKRLGEVVTSRRFIYQSLQAACMVSRGGDERDECLFHLGESHDMETCPAVEEFLQRLMDCWQLEVSIGGREEPQICMQSEEKKVPLTPKALVICFTRKGIGSTPIYPRTAPKPTPFAYQSNKAVPWKYTPPASSERVATEVDSLSAKVTNITGLSGVTRSDRVFASPHLVELPSKGKAPMVQEPTDDCLGNADVVDIKGNPYKYGLGYEPGMLGRRNVPSRFRADRVWPGRISQCFTSAGMVSEEEVAAIEEEFPQDPPSFVQPCHPDSQVGNWRVISQSEVYTTDSM